METLKRELQMWTHKKYGKTKWIGSYGTDNRGERVFYLTKDIKPGRKHRNISFESWQMAKDLGWKKGK